MGGGATVVVAAVVVVVVGCATVTDVVAFTVVWPGGPAFALNVMPLAVVGTEITRVWGAAESGVDQVHWTAVAVLVQEDSPGVNDTRIGAPPPLVLMLT